MKHIKLLTYTLTPLLAIQTQPYLNLLHSRTSDWKQFQTLIHSQEYLEKYQTVEQSWNALDDDIEDWPEYNGYNISSYLFGKFYNDFKILLDHNLNIFSYFNTDKYAILETYNEQLMRIYIVHNKNSIKKLQNNLGWEELIKLSKIFVNNLSDIWKKTQYFYKDLKNISYEQFV